MDSKKKILVIESVESCIGQFEQLFSEKYRIAVAFNNAQGFEEAKSADKPGLILISEMGDVVDSFELCRLLKNDMNTFSIPILLIHDETSGKPNYRGFDVGVADYISFPLAQAVLFARVETHLNLADLEKEVERLEIHDGLTGLFNRTYFDEYLKQEWLRARRSEQPLGLMLIQIDGFEEYNQHYGHSELEATLKSLSTVISRRLCRPADMVSRFKVKSFACVLPDTDHPGLLLIAEELMAAVAELEIKHQFAGPSGWLTVSIAADFIVPSGADQFIGFCSSVNKLFAKKLSQEYGRIIFSDS